MLTVLVPAVAEAAPAVAAPSKVSAKVSSNGSVKLTWSKVKGSHVTYTVASIPAGASCRTMATSCSLSLSSALETRFSVVATTTAGSSAPSPMSNTIATRTVLIVAGQSNAMGANSFATDPATKVNYFAAPYANGADSADSIQWSNYFVSPAPASSTGLVALNTPQNATSSPTGQIFGPEIGLARQLYADSGVPVTIVKSAYPGSSLANDWCQTCAAYTKLKIMVTTRIRADAARGVADVVAGFYWYQGEADTANPTWASAYEGNLVRLDSYVRTEMHLVPDAPFAIAKESVSDYISYLQATGGCGADNCAAYQAGNTAVRAADDELQATMPNVVVVDTTGLARWAPGNYVHLTNQSELTIGQQLARATESQLGLK